MPYLSCLLALNCWGRMVAWLLQSLPPVSHSGSMVLGLVALLVTALLPAGTRKLPLLPPMPLCCLPESGGEGVGGG